MSVTSSAAEADDPRGSSARAAVAADSSVTGADSLTGAIWTSVEFTALTNAAERPGYGAALDELIEAAVLLFREEPPLSCPWWAATTTLTTTAMVSGTATTQVVRVLLGDLAEEGMLRIVSAQRQPVSDHRLLKMVLDGLESL